MDPNTGNIYSGEALDALERQSTAHPQDKPLKSMLKRMVPLTDDQHRKLAALTLRERLTAYRKERFAIGGTADDRRLMRNARKRERAERR